MNFTTVPVGFGMALAMNESAMAVYAAMNEREKQTVLRKAHYARSEEEMRQIVNHMAAD